MKAVTAKRHKDFRDERDGPAGRKKDAVGETRNEGPEEAWLRGRETEARPMEVFGERALLKLS